jgi:predicted ATPase
VVLIGGEAGVGKSRLISELARRADQAGVVVVIGECLPLGDAEPPFAPLIAALRTVPGPLTRSAGHGSIVREANLGRNIPPLTVGGCDVD